MKNNAIGIDIRWQLVCCLFLVLHTGKGQSLFTDITDSSGIDHQFVVYEGMFGGGACVIDFNNDGFEDVYITGGKNDDQLYVNNGDGTFENVFEGSGLELTKHYVTQGVAGADVNRDGWVDLFITTITSRDSVKVIPRAINLLFLNNGDHTFRDVTTKFGLDQLMSFSTAANFGDFNADGYPDLYVGNYFLEYDGPLNSISDATIVNATETAEGYLLINKGGEGFENVYHQYGLSHKGFGFGGVFTDYDNDGDQDLFIHNDFGYKATPDLLLQNQNNKEQFVDVGEEKGMDLKINSMGTAIGDFDNNGLLDYFITNIRFNLFMVNQGEGQPFVDKSKELGMSYVTISWGANFADFDHDGDLDLFVANGDLNPNDVPMGNFYFENDGKQFMEKGREIGVNDYGLGRGSVVLDIENDGDLDLLVVNQGPVLDYPVPSRTLLYRNDNTNGNWLKVKLEGKSSELNGIGSRIEVWKDGKTMLREVDGGSSHLSQNSTITHFGLGDASIVDSVLVKWLEKETAQVITQVAANQVIIIKEPERVEGNFSTIMHSISIYLIGALVTLISGVLFFKMRKPKSNLSGDL